MTTVRHGDVTRVTDTVDLEVPADPAYLAVVRTATAGLATRLEFTLDEIDDLRIAVEEAAVQLLRHARGERLELDICGTPAGVEVRLAADVVSEEPVIDQASFSWAILSALADELSVEMRQRHATIVLTKHHFTSAAEGGA